MEVFMFLDKAWTLLAKSVLVFFLISNSSACSSLKGEQASIFDKKLAADARIELGLNYLQLDRLEQAQHNLQLALEYEPNYERAISSIAYYYQYTHQYDKAHCYYKKALKRAPHKGELLNNYAVFLCRQNQFDLAIDYFEQAGRQDNYKSRLMSLENAGICCLKQGNEIQANAYFKRVLSLNPDYQFAHKQTEPH